MEKDLPVLSQESKEDAKKIKKASSIVNEVFKAKNLGSEILMINNINHVTIQCIHEMTPIDKMNIVRLGISKINFDKIKKYIGMDYDLLAKSLSVTRATLINKKGADKFNTKVSEGIIGLSEIYSFGYKVFEDIERFRKWMFEPNNALGGIQPCELLDNQYGRQEVMNIVGRIEYGVYS